MFCIGYGIYTRERTAPKCIFHNHYYKLKLYTLATAISVQKKYCTVTNI